jgi:hypothetical protein
VPGLRPQDELGARDAIGEVLAVRPRDDEVAGALHDERRHADVGDVEAPGADEGAVVVDEAVGAVLLVGRAAVGAERAPGAVEGGPVRVDELLGVELSGLGVPGAGLAAALERRPQALGSVHPAEPVEFLRVGRDPGEGGDRQDAVRQQRRARERVRTAAGVADRREPVETERIGDRGDVRRGARDVAAGVR